MKLFSRHLNKNCSANILAVLLVTGCGHAVEDVSKTEPKPPEIIPTVTAQLSNQLQSLQSGNLGKLKSELQIDNSEPKPMLLAENNTQFSISQPDIDKTKPYKIAVNLNYILKSNPDFPLTLAHVTQQSHDFNSQPHKIFNSKDFDTSYDQDMDGMSNLAELLVGGNPFNAAPTIITPANVSVKEGQTEVLIVQAIAPGDSAVLTYSLTGGADENLFSINKDSGELSFITAPLYNDTVVDSNKYTVVVTVSDDSLSLSQTITVTVTDLFDLKITVSFKQFLFNWSDYPGAVYYKIKEFPNGNAGNVKELKNSDGSANLIGLQYEYSIGAHLINQANALYLLEAYNVSDILLKTSTAISIADILAGAVGYIKANDTAVDNQFNDTTADDQFGYSISLSADSQTLVVGAPYSNINGNNNILYVAAGAAYVFCRDIGGNWPKQGVKLQASDPDAAALFGYSVDLSADGQILVVGARYAEAQSNGSLKHNAGAVYVFDRDTSGNWLQAGKLQAIDAADYDQMGISVNLSADGQTLVSGTPWADVNGSIDAGAVYVFNRDTSGTWSQVGKLLASDAASGDWLGQSISISADGQTVVAGAPLADINGFADSGAVYTFILSNNGDWSLPGIKLHATDNSIGDQFGFSVSTDGLSLVVAAPYTDINSLTNVGVAYVFSSDTNGNWIQPVKLEVDNAASGDQFGFSLNLSIDGQALVVAAPYTDVNGQVDSGTVYVFRRDTDGNWPKERIQLQVSDTDTGDLFGFSTSLSADGLSLAIGAPLEDSNATGFALPPESQKDNSNLSSGAAYMY